MQLSCSDHAKHKGHVDADLSGVRAPTPHSYTLDCIPACHNTMTRLSFHPYAAVLGCVDTTLLTSVSEIYCVEITMGTGLF